MSDASYYQGLANQESQNHDNAISQKAAADENFNRFNNGMDLIEGYYDLFVKGARSHLSPNSMEK